MRVLLNIVKRENFVFFDHVNKVHLNRVSPFGEVSILSDSLKRAIVAGNVIDIDNEFNVEISNKVKKINDALLASLNIKTKVKEEVKEERLIEETEIKEEIIEEVKEDKKKKTKSKGAK